MQYRRDIDGLRAVALALVLLYHLGIPLAGFVGVDIFFVISGFLITSLVLARERQRPSAFHLRVFYIRRARRLLPALHATLAATLAAAAVTLPPAPRRAVASSAVAALLSVSNLAFCQEAGYFDVDAAYKPLLHTWSLSVEEQFYLVWPAALVALLRVARRLRVPERRVVPPVVAAAAVASLALAEWDMGSRPAAVFFLPQYRACEFLLGALLSFGPRPSHRGIAETAVSIGLAMIVAAVAHFDEETPFPGVRAMLPCAGAALVVHAGGTSSVARLILGNTGMVYVGRVSYSLYLVHWPAIVMMKFWGGDEGSRRWEGVAGGAMSVVGGVALHHVVEKPFRAMPVGGEGGKGETAATEGKLVMDGASSCQRPVSRAVLAITYVVLLGTLLLSVLELVSVPLAKLMLPVAALRQGRVASTDRPDSDVLAAVGSEFLRYPNVPDVDILPRIPQLLNRRVGSFDTSASEALIIGDSHAGRLLAFAHYIGTKYNVRFFVSSYPGCSPLLGVKKMRKSVGVGQNRIMPDDIQRCPALVREWRDVALRGNFSVIFLVSRWSTSTEDGEYFTRGPLAEYRLLSLHADQDDRDLPSLQESQSLFATSLRQTALKFASSSARVIIMSEPPDVGRGSFQCKNWLRRGVDVRNPEHQVLGSMFPQTHACTGATRAMALKRLNYTNRVVREIADSDARIETITPSKYFCDNHHQDRYHCRVIWKDKMLYQDSDHLSDWGALYLALRWETDRDAYFPKGWAFM